MSKKVRRCLVTLGISVILVGHIGFNIMTSIALARSDFDFINYTLKEGESLEILANKIAKTENYDYNTVLAELKRVNPGVAAPGTTIKIID